MPYNSNNIMCGRGQVNCEATPTAPAYHTYRTTDTLEDVLVSGYFTDNFGFSEGSFQQGDLLWLQTDTDKALFWLSAVTPVPVLSENLTPANIVGEEDIDGSIELDGPWPGEQNPFFSAVKIGSMVMVKFLGVSDIYAGSAKITGTLSLPEDWYPPVATYQSINVINNSVFAPGYCSIGSAGEITIGTYQVGNNFTAGNVGFEDFVLSYNVYD